MSRGGEEDVWIYGYYEGGGMSVTLKRWFGQTDLNNPLGAQQKRLVVTFKGDNVKEAKFAQEFEIQHSQMAAASMRAREVGLPTSSSGMNRKVTGSLVFLLCRMR